MKKHFTDRFLYYGHTHSVHQKLIMELELKYIHPGSITFWHPRIIRQVHHQIQDLKTKKTMKPKYIEDKHIAYLNGLKYSGIPMLRARPFLEIEFNLTPEQASNILIYWMQNIQNA